ncbi:g11653 [Coccomyxa viridis]|uniref:G11653 protein n=1 Tax=Coccomyxa viridis TaxID=1274662 RepID=A0ABP1GD46_9CHLO
MSAAAVVGTTGDTAATATAELAAGDKAAESSAPAAELAGSGLGAHGKKVSTQDIQLVQNLIERCLQMYMSQREVVYTLQQQAKVEPGFTQLVWQKLEEQNPDFFKAYYTRLKLKDQIVLFNHLLEQQVAMFQKMQRQCMAPAGMMLGPRPMMPMPGMPYHMGMSMPMSSIPSPAPAPMMGIKAEGGLDLAEGADRSDHGQAGDSPMDIAGLSLPHTASVDGLHNQSHPFNSADSLGAVMMSMSSPLRTSGSGDLGMGRNLSFGNFGTIGDFDPMGTNHDSSMLQSHTPQDLPRNFSLSELAGLDDLDGKQPGS